MREKKRRENGAAAILLKLSRLSQQKETLRVKITCELGNLSDHIMLTMYKLGRDPVNPRTLWLNYIKSNKQTIPNIVSNSCNKLTIPVYQNLLSFSFTPESASFFKHKGLQKTTMESIFSLMLSSNGNHIPQVGKFNIAK